MPAGWVGAYGAQGVHAALRQQIADRIAAEERAAKATQLETENTRADRALDLTDALRREQLEGTLANQASLMQDRAAGQAASLADDIPAQTVMGLQDRGTQTMQRGGLDGLLAVNRTLPSTQTSGYQDLPGGSGPMQGQLRVRALASDQQPQSVTKLESPAQRNSREDNTRATDQLERQRDRDAELARSAEAREARMLMALQQPGIGEHGGVVRVTTRRSPVDGRDETVAVFRDGSIQVVGDTQLPAGMKKASVVADELLSQIQNIEALGKLAEWQGVGMVTAPLANLQRRVTGGGDQTQSLLRKALATLKAEIAHEKYGSAFTAQERAMLSEFAPAANSSAADIQDALLTMKRAMTVRKQELAARPGLTPDQAAPLSVGPGGPDPATMNPADYLRYLRQPPTRTP